MLKGHKPLPSAQGYKPPGFGHLWTCNVWARGTQALESLRAGGTLGLEALWAGRSWGWTELGAGRTDLLGRRRRSCLGIGGGLGGFLFWQPQLAPPLPLHPNTNQRCTCCGKHTIRCCPPRMEKAPLKLRGSHMCTSWERSRGSIV